MNVGFRVRRWRAGADRFLSEAERQDRVESGHQVAGVKRTLLICVGRHDHLRSPTRWSAGKAMRFTRWTSYIVLAALVAWNSAIFAAYHVIDAQESGPDAAHPSFDCAQAKSAREKTICGDPALSALDGQLGYLYHKKIALLSSQGAKLLQESERNWLRFVGIVCPLNAPDEKPSVSKKRCLIRRYNERIIKLGAAAQNVGPYVFSRVDLYDATPSGDEMGSVEGFYVQHVSYPQVDNAKSPEVRAWNQASVRSLPTDGDFSPCDYDIDYEIGLANAHVISTQWIDSTYCHGAAHGFGNVRSANIILAPKSRPLMAEDMFEQVEDWKEKLKKSFWEDLTRTGWSPPDKQSYIKQQLENDAVQPDRWFFTRDGLQVSFDSYEGGCYACTPQPVTLPWSELKPLLSKNAIAP